MSAQEPPRIPSRLDVHLTTLYFRVAEDWTDERALEAGPETPAELARLVDRGLVERRISYRLTAAGKSEAQAALKAIEPEEASS